MRVLASIGILLLVAIGIPGCMYVSIDNTFQRRDEFVKQAWTGILTAYKNRADTIPALVETTKGYTNYEGSITVKHAEAQAAAQKVQIPENASPEDLQRFLAIQKELSAGLGRLLAVAYTSPNLKADQQFINLQNKVADFNTQIMANQRKYVREVTAFNINIRSWPNRWVASWNGYKLKPQLAFDDEPEIKKMPTINFGGKS